MLVSQHEIRFQVFFTCFKPILPFAILDLLEFFVKLIFRFVIQLFVSFFSFFFCFLSFSGTFVPCIYFLILMRFTEFFQQKVSGKVLDGTYETFDSISYSLTVCHDHQVIQKRLLVSEGKLIVVAKLFYLFSIFSLGSNFHFKNYLLRGWSLCYFPRFEFVEDIHTYHACVPILSLKVYTFVCCLSLWKLRRFNLPHDDAVQF